MVYIPVMIPPPITKAGARLVPKYQGGAFIEDSSSIAGYEGSDLAANQDVVVVSMNYHNLTFPNMYFFPGENVGVYTDQRPKSERYGLRGRPE